MSSVEKKAIVQSGRKRPSPSKQAKGIRRRPSVSLHSKIESRPVTLRTREKKYVISGKWLKPISMQWYYMVRHRNRWSDSPEARQSLRQAALKSLRAFDITQTEVDEIKDAELVEVSIPFEDTEHGWEPRILPWEFLLRTATAKPDLTIVRHLDVKKSRERASRLPDGQKSETKALNPPSSLLFVQSSPGTPFAHFSFDTEQCLVQGSLRLTNYALTDPTPVALKQRIAAVKPNIIHLAGFDIHQGDEIVEKYNRDVRCDRQVKTEGDQDWDGMYLAGETPYQINRVTAEEMGHILNPKDALGALVTFNIYHSAARIAALAVAQGSAAAIGFQDVVDDALAERFFAIFFQQWRTREWNLLQAFEQAWKRVGVADGRDCGVVLWTRTSLLDAARDPSVPPKKSAAADPLKINADNREAFKLLVEPNPDVNYSLLHNGQGLFNRFRFEKYEPNYAYGIRVSVALHMGAESFPYEATFDLEADEPILDIARHVNLPLTSQFARSLREDVLTSLRVSVVYNEQQLYTETHRVKMLAVNQWTFDRREGGRWLASFVLPGDPAVSETVDLAQKYLMALRDDPSVGFDGYQSTDDSNPDQRDQGVDMQVRALWAALTFDLRLNYINPPPVFTEGEQRLRTPSDVIRGRRGTCIDLALLFAACLEYVEIYPVIFLLTDHAFPGYWRNEQSYQDFLEIKNIQKVVAFEQTVDASYTGQRRLRFEEMRQWVRDGHLVPLETVWLTSHRGFADAVDAGIDNLRTSNNFESLVNIKKLRDERVTPLPIAGELK